MQAPCLASNEAERLTALRSYAVLDTVCEAAFDNIVELAAVLTNAPICLVSLIDADRQWFKARHGLDLTEMPREISFCAHAILNAGEPLIVEDARLDPRFADNPLVTGSFGLRFYAGVPLVGRDQAALGTLCILDRQPRRLSATERMVLTRLADSVMTTLELRRVTAQLQRFSLRDFITGLPNREAMRDAIGRAMAAQQRHGGVFCLLHLDLDGFKRVNERHGRATGDAVLCEVATALQVVLRQEDFAARTGGDEFALLIQNDESGAECLAARLRQELGVRMQVHGWRVTCSIGLACFASPPATAQEVLQRAHAEMLRGKETARRAAEAGRDRHAEATPG